MRDLELGGFLRNMIVIADIITNSLVLIKGGLGLIIYYMHRNTLDTSYRSRWRRRTCWLSWSKWLETVRAVGSFGYLFRSFIKVFRGVQSLGDHGQGIVISLLSFR